MVTRRQTLFAAAAAPVALAGASLPAFAHQSGAQVLHNRIRIGGFDVTSLLAGTRTVADPQQTFGTNVPAEDFAKVAEAAFIPTDKTQFFFTPVLVDTGKEKVLFDTGADPAGIVAALAEAGVAPDQIDVVVLTHMHGDHIGGLAGPSGPTFAKARYVTGAIEHNHWSAQGNEGFDKLVKPLNDKMTFVEDGGTAASGITAVMAPGHTPGHMAWHLESEGQRLMLTADLANHYVWSLQHPDWEVRFDADKALAAQSRRRVLGQIAADRIPMIGYHMPFPALGFVSAEGEGFKYHPATYQFMLA